jgi:predicted nucleic acid-binding protein
VSASTFFPDTTVLINFGLINRLGLLQQMFATRYWGYTVSEECADQFRRHSITSYGMAQSIFGRPLMPDQPETINTKVLRSRIAKPTDAPDKHMGEAETIIIATSRDFERPIFLTDDGGAANTAVAHGIIAVSTWDVIRLAVRRGDLTEADAWTDAKFLRKVRGIWPPKIGHTHADFIAWLRA